MLPSLLFATGRFTPPTGLTATAFFSHRYSNNEDRAESVAELSARTGPAVPVFPPGNDMRPRDCSEFFRLSQPEESENSRTSIVYARRVFSL